MLVPALCPNCNGTLEIDDKQEAAVCKYCSTPFIVEKAINNYVTNHNTYIQNATIVNKDSDETLLKKGITQIEIGQYEDAIDTFALMSKEYPENWKGWFGLSLANFYMYPEEGFLMDEAIYKIIPENVLVEINEEYAPVEIVDIERLEEKICKVRANTDVYIEDKENVDESITKNQLELSQSKRKTLMLFVCGIIGGISIFLFGFWMISTMRLLALIFICGSGYWMYRFAFKEVRRRRTIECDITQEVSQLTTEQKHLEKKIDSGEAKYSQYVSDQDELNKILEGKLAAKGTNSAQQYYFDVLINN